MDEQVLNFCVLKSSMPRKGFSPKVRKNQKSVPRAQKIVDQLRY